MVFPGAEAPRGPLSAASVPTSQGDGRRCVRSQRSSLARRWSRVVTKKRQDDVELRGRPTPTASLFCPPHPEDGQSDEAGLTDAPARRTAFSSAILHIQGARRGPAIPQKKGSAIASLAAKSIRAAERHQSKTRKPVSSSRGLSSVLLVSSVDVASIRTARKKRSHGAPHGSARPARPLRPQLCHSRGDRRLRALLGLELFEAQSPA